VADQLAAHGYTCELVLIETFGDRTQAANVPLHSIGGQGVFVKEVQRAVLDGRADLAVHSAKDLPSTPAEGLTIGAYTTRRSPADALVGSSLAALPEGATVATGSVRRQAQLLHARPDLVFTGLRGNIHSRLSKVPEGGAIVIARAALEVLELTDVIDETLDPALFVPAVGQGCVAVECRDLDHTAGAALAAIDDQSTRRAITIERSFLGELGSGCSLPVGAYVVGDVLRSFVAGEGSAVSHDRLDLTGDLTADIAIARAAARRALAAVAGS
jgi:hydroxymethylbilane synthase